MSQLQALNLTEDEWAEQYKPKRNHLDPNASWQGWGYEDGGILFETYDDEEDFVSSTDKHYVWTLVEDEGRSLILNGHHFVNRLGYFICEVGWSDLDGYLAVPIEENNE